MAYEPNEEQLGALDNVVHGTGHSVWRARAGTGKTATLIQALRHVPRDPRGNTLGSVVMLAFNGDIAKELAGRAPSGVEVKTLHALGLKTLNQQLDGVTVEKGRCRRIAQEISGADTDPKRRAWGHDLEKVVSRCKNVLAETSEEIDAVIDLLGQDHPEPPADFHRCAVCRRWAPIDESARECGHAGCKGAMRIETLDNRPEFIRQVLQCMERSTYDFDEAGNRTTPKTVDFDCMVYLPIAMKLRLPKYDWVFVDECQDLNALQIEFVLGICGKGGRITAVGDNRQAIYGFRGAAEGALDYIRERLDANVMPMTMTYRCGTAIVKEAQRWVPDIQAAPGQHAGTFEDSVSPDRMMVEAGPGDFILSRSNAPLLGICMAFIVEGRRANILGRDLGERLAGIVRRAKVQDCEGVRVYAKMWAEREAQRLRDKGNDESAIWDTLECLIALSDGARDAGDIYARISRIFDDTNDADRITLSTTHRAKGKERDRVWVLRDTYWGAGKGVEAEDNLLYVATTRAKNHLLYVRTPKSFECRY
jgi:DNA helicase-2/ATP-dependent DNA helicase PcrA